MFPQLGSVPMVLALSIGLNPFIYNVFFVALYLPAMGTGVSQGQLMALAAGSTIAGNLLILGAANNVIILQNAEKENETFFYQIRHNCTFNFIFRSYYLLYISLNFKSNNISLNNDKKPIISLNILLNPTNP
ncbi:transporter permease [Methanosarcina siciliae]|nr:hypothetical protein [Methanosarcina siciliae]